MKTITVVIENCHYTVTLLTVYDGDYQYRLRLSNRLIAQASHFKTANMARIAGVQGAFEHWRKTSVAHV